MISFAPGLYVPSSPGKGVWTPLANVVRVRDEGDSGVIEFSQGQPAIVAGEAWDRVKVQLGIQAHREAAQRGRREAGPSWQEHARSDQPEATDGPPVPVVREAPAAESVPAPAPQRAVAARSQQRAART